MPAATFVIIGILGIDDWLATPRTPIEDAQLRFGQVERHSGLFGTSRTIVGLGGNLLVEDAFMLLHPQRSLFALPPSYRGRL